MFKQVLEKAGTASMRAKMAATAVMVPVASGLLPVVAHAAEGDASDVSTVVSMVTSVMTLLTAPPLSYFLGGGLALMAFKVFSGGKRAAK